jgi:selenium-binding protein 1
MDRGCRSIQDRSTALMHVKRSEMMLMTPDPTFYPSPAMAVQAPPETLGYVALINPLEDGRSDALGVIELDPSSPSYGHIVGRTDMPQAGDELHHFGWNACSSCLCPYAAHPHMERRYLIVPGIHSSRIHILDTKADPRRPQIVKVIEPQTVFQRTGYAAPHTVHCGPDGIFVSALGAPDGDGPGGTFIIDPETFDLRGRWEIDRGPQELAYDVWWHLGQDTMITSTWARRTWSETVSTPSSCSAGNTETSCTSGTYGDDATCSSSILALNSRWCWNCGRLTILGAPTGSPASWCR